MGPEGQVPSMLVSGTLPTLPTPNKNIPEQDEKMKALHTSREEVPNIRAEQRIRKVIRHNIRPAAHYKLESSALVYAYSYSRKR